MGVIINKNSESAKLIKETQARSQKYSKGHSKDDDLAAKPNTTGKLANGQKMSGAASNLRDKISQKLGSTNNASIATQIKNFVPYACFYDENTILTKNGELLQVIKFANFTHDETLEESFNLRDSIRSALKETLRSRDFSFWIHTVRREKDIEWLKTKETDSFQYIAHQNWRIVNKFDGAFVNEVYLTVLIRGVDYPLFNLKTMFSFFNKSFLEKTFYGYLQNQHERLMNFCDEIVFKTSKFLPKKLGFYKKDDDFYYSEHLEFFDKILNLINVTSPVPIADISELLNVSKYRLGFNNIAVQNPVKKSVIALFSIKDYQEISVNLVSKLTSLNIELIIYQTYDSANSPLSRQHYQNAAEVFKISKDEEFYQKSGIKDIMESGSGKSHFGEHQISVLIYAANEVELSKRVDLFVHTLSEVGFCMVREDLFNEDVFYGVLPANYEFLKRRKYSHLSRFGAFAITANYPSGNAFPAKWKKPITAFTTIRKTPYFFNFHFSENSAGHTIILGPKGSGASVLSNFLLCESLKLKPKIISLSVNRQSNVFFNAIGGLAKTFYANSTQQSTQEDRLLVNPFILLHSRHERIAKFHDDNLLFVKKFLTGIMQYNTTKMTPAEFEDFEEAFKKMSANIFKVKSVADFASLVTERSNLRRLRRYIDGEYSHMLSTQDDFENFDKVLSINMQHLINDEAAFAIFFDYIFYRMDLELDGNPFIIKLDDIIELFSTDKFKPSVFDSWIRKLQKYNAICLINLDSANVNYLRQYISESFFTQADSIFFMPEKSSLVGNVVSSRKDYEREQAIKQFYRDVLNMPEKDIKSIFSLAQMDERHLMLRHNKVDVVLKFDLSRIPQILLLLSSQQEVEELYNAIKSTLPQNPPFSSIYEKFCMEIGVGS